jgi:hypothetical protein
MFATSSVAGSVGLISCRELKNEFTVERTGRKVRRGGPVNSFIGRIYESGKWSEENSQSHKLDDNHLPSVCCFPFGFRVTDQLMACSMVGRGRAGFPK